MLSGTLRCNNPGTDQNFADRINETAKKETPAARGDRGFRTGTTEVRNQYPQTFTVRQRKPNGVGTRRVTKHPSPP
jgi:hypothetical protein